VGHGSSPGNTLSCGLEGHCLRFTDPDHHTTALPRVGKDHDRKTSRVTENTIDLNLEQIGLSGVLAPGRNAQQSRRQKEKGDRDFPNIADETTIYFSGG
jgi:hypothetical protein